MSQRKQGKQVQQAQQRKQVRQVQQRQQNRESYLPPEMWDHIFGFVPKETHGPLARVNSVWYDRLKAKRDGPQWHTGAAVAAASAKILRQSIADGYQINDATISHVLTIGDLEALQLIHKAGRKFTAADFARAVEHGQLPILKWLQSIGCPHDKSAFTSAPTLLVLRWLYTLGRPSLATRYMIAESCTLDMFQWLTKTNEFDKRDFTIMSRVLSSGDLDKVKWAIKNNFAYDSSQVQHALYHEHILNWLVANNMCTDEDIADAHALALEEAAMEFVDEEFDEVAGWDD